MCCNEESFWEDLEDKIGGKLAKAFMAAIPMATQLQARARISDMNSCTR